jgi:predicted dithiol-disulfide oxidoreductase (DUF899 family)
MANTSDQHSDQHKVVSEAEWVTARKELLRKEKEFTRLRDDLSRERRAMPWVRVDKTYTFDGPSGKVKLGDLFDGKSQLVVYHFMFGPDWKEGCPSCSYLMDHIDGALLHLAARDVSFVAVSRAPLSSIDPFKKRLGWHFRWVSSADSDFNFDYNVSFKGAKGGGAGKQVYYNYTTTDFPSEEAPGLSVFYRDKDGAIYHTYSSYARGLDILVGTYNYLDLVPKGRDEDGLPHSMAWVRYHDRYSDGQLAGLTRSERPAANSPAPLQPGAQIRD